VQPFYYIYYMEAVGASLGAFLANFRGVVGATLVMTAAVVAVHGALHSLLPTIVVGVAVYLPALRAFDGSVFSELRALRSLRTT
jgi:hypothetical protein